jgi:FdrA protein
VSVVRNRVRRRFYLDSVALMRLAREISALPGIDDAALMIGTQANLRLVEEAGLLAEEGRSTGPDDLLIAVAAGTAAEAEAALAAAAAKLDRTTHAARGVTAWRPRSIDAAVEALPGADLAFVSVPGAFAAGEAMKALRRGLHVMIFSDNVPLADERRLKEEAARRGLLLMGPDCGTAFIAGAPLGFANAVPRGAIGIVAASGTGLQEVACLVARAGEGISHGIGVGGRDLGEAVGGLGMLAAIDALDADNATKRIVLVSKPPSPDVAARLADRIAASAKRFTVCFLGAGALDLPPNAHTAATLRDAAADAVGHPLGWPMPEPPPSRAGRLRGLFAGGTLCAEAQLVLRAAGLEIASNAPVPGARRPEEGAPNLLLDLGADEYTLGRPHPMIDPALRTPHLEAALADGETAIVLVDVVLGFGGHPDPAGAVADAVARFHHRRPVVVASVTGTDADPQNRAAQVARLQAAGIVVAPSNADAAALAARLVTS